MTEIDVLRARREALEIANETLHEAFLGIDGDPHTALEIAKQNVKLMTALRATQLEHGRVIASLVTDVAGMTTALAGLTNLVAGLTTDVTGLMNVVAGLTTDVTGLTTDVTGLKDDAGEIKSGLTEVLRRLPGPGSGA